MAAMRTVLLEIALTSHVWSDCISLYKIPGEFYKFGSLGFSGSLQFVLDCSYYLLDVEQDYKGIKNMPALKEWDEYK